MGQEKYIRKKLRLILGSVIYSRTKKDTKLIRDKIMSYLPVESQEQTEGSVPGHPPALQMSEESSESSGIPTLNTSAKRVCRLSPFSPSFVPRAQRKMYSEPMPDNGSGFWSPSNGNLRTDQLRSSPKAAKRKLDLTWFHKLSQNHGSWRPEVDTPVGEGVPSGVNTTLTKVFVGSLAWKTTSRTLYQHFKRYGTILEAAVIYDENGPRPRSRGFGFVTFSDPSCALQATSVEHPVIDGRRTDVTLAALGTHCKTEATIPANHAAWLHEMVQARKGATPRAMNQTSPARHQQYNAQTAPARRARAFTFDVHPSRVPGLHQRGQSHNGFDDWASRRNPAKSPTKVLHVSQAEGVQRKPRFYNSRLQNVKRNLNTGNPLHNVE